MTFFYKKERLTKTIDNFDTIKMTKINLLQIL
jgi:hypothetical protein